MAEENGEKTEAPTARRRTEAREQGQIARSPDLSAAALLIGILLLLHSFGDSVVLSLRSIVSDSLGKESIAGLDPIAAAQQLARALTAIGVAMAPILGGIILIAVAANLIQERLGHGQQYPLKARPPMPVLRRKVRPAKIRFTLRSQKRRQRPPALPAD